MPFEHSASSAALATAEAGRIRPRPRVRACVELGQTEKAANAILRRQLAAVDLTEPQWVALVVAAGSDGSLTRSRLIDDLASAAKFGPDEADAHIDELGAARLLDLADDDHGTVAVSEAGRRTIARIRAETAEITRRLWGDLDADDLVTTGTVLRTILARADTELAGV